MSFNIIYIIGRTLLGKCRPIVIVLSVGLPVVYMKRDVSELWLNGAC